jgi:LacI family transcriptional regulator
MSRNVLIALGRYDHRLIRGIGTYATEHNWHIAAASVTQEFLIPWGWDGSGILTWLAGDQGLADFVLSVGKPTVDFSLRHKELPFCRVLMDHAAASRMAAGHLIHKGFRNYVFYSASDNWTFEERGTAFLATLREHGHDAAWLKWHKSSPGKKSVGDWKARSAWLVAQLKKLPKPVGIFTATGTLAVEVSEACKDAELKIPEQVAIVGVEDDLLPALSLRHSITAIDPNFEELGYQGAALLEKMMNGGKLPDAPIRIPPARLIVRQSTDITAVTHPGLKKAVQYIADNFSGAIDVESVARVAGMSRRGLHQRFMEHLHHTPGDLIRGLRMEKAKCLLAETDCKIEEVARLSGYTTVNSFFIAFKHACHNSPAEYRKEIHRWREKTPVA